MINLKANLTYNIYNLEIKYFEKEQMSDFEYLVILITEELIKSGDELNEENFNKHSLQITENVNSDFSMLMWKRCVDLISTDDINEIKKIIEESKKNSTRLTKSSTNRKIFYNEDLELFFYDSKFISLKEIEKLVKSEVEEKENIFNEIISSVTDELSNKDHDVSFDDKMTKFNIVNLEEIENKNITNNILETELQRAKNLLPAETIKAAKEVKSTNDKLIQLDKTFIEGQFKEELITQENNKIILFNFIKKQFETYEFYSLKNLILQEIKKSSFLEFKTSKDYDNLCKELEKNEKFSNMFIKEFFLNVETRDELNICKSLGIYTHDIDRTIELIPLMIEEEINIIEDESFILNNIFDKMVYKHPTTLYEFINKFITLSKEDKSKAKYIDLLFSVYYEKNNILLKEDKELIKQIITDNNSIYDSIQSSINKIINYRTDINNLIDKYKKDDEDRKEEIAVLNKLKAVTNLAAHIKDSDSSLNNSTKKNVSSFDKNLLSFRKRFKDSNKEDIKNIKVTSDDVKYMSEISNRIEKEFNNLR